MTTYSTNLNLKQIDIGLLILRLGVAGMMLSHGVPKLITLFGSEEINFADPYGFGPGISLALVVFAEFICSILIIIGLATRLATIPLIINMATAFFIIHADDPFREKELALFYLLIWVVLLITGGGKYSLDYYLLKKDK